MMAPEIECQVYFGRDASGRDKLTTLMRGASDKAKKKPESGLDLCERAERTSKTISRSECINSPYPGFIK
ncbi:MAG: hypothetical protein QXE73_06845 [Candidatus Bathyarchaeia archaeon]